MPFGARRGARARARWLARAGHRRGPLFLGARGGADDRAQVLRARAREPRARAGITRHGEPAHAAPHVRDAPARRRRRPSRDPGAARPQPALHDPALHARRRRPPAQGLRRGASAGPRGARRAPRDAATFHATTVVCVRHRGQVAHRRRRSGVDRPDDREGQRAQGAQALPRPRACPASRAPPPTPSRCSRASRRKLEEHRGNLARAAVELAKDWRTDRVLRRLEALLAVADQRAVLHHLRHRRRHRARRRADRHRLGRAVRARRRRARSSATRTSTRRAIVTEAMRIAAGICIYTNDHITVETL